MVRANIKQQPQQLDLFQNQTEYPKEIVQVIQVRRLT